MISYFEDDPYDPGGRGPRSEALLAAHGVPHLVIDQPEGFAGHSADDGGLFLAASAPACSAVAGNGPMPSRKACDKG